MIIGQFDRRVDRYLLLDRTIGLKYAVFRDDTVARYHGRVCPMIWRERVDLPDKLLIFQPLGKIECGIDTPVRRDAKAKRTPALPHDLFYELWHGTSAQIQDKIP